MLLEDMLPGENLEDSVTEFKGMIRDDGDELKWLRTLAAFANTQGGLHIDLKGIKENDLVKVLFAENPGVVIQVKNDDKHEVKKILENLEVGYCAIGHPVDDRKLRVVGENTSDAKEWIKWATEAYKSIYGFEWQGDNLVLARESMVYTFLDFYEAKFGTLPPKAQTRKIAEIVSWNLWQMDGLKGVIPGSCYDKVTKEYTLFGEEIEYVEKCEGCEKDDIYKHNGIYCRIKDWGARKTVRFIDLLKK